jgi:hypothetical protein
VSSVRRPAQVPEQGATIVDGALTNGAKGVRMGDGDDQAARLGQGGDPGESDKPGH